MKEKIDKVVINSLLYDFYGNLLTDRQKEILELYHEENLSLSEISEQLNISRQGVHDALKKAEKVLEEYEVKLELVEKFVRSEIVIQQIGIVIDRIEEGIKVGQTQEKTINELEEIRKIIKSINE